jgi:hypothetical protein
MLKIGWNTKKEGTYRSIITYQVPLSFGYGISILKKNQNATLLYPFISKKTNFLEILQQKTSPFAVKWGVFFHFLLHSIYF